MTDIGEFDAVEHRVADHYIGENLPVPKTVSNGGLPAVGISPIPSREDHVHGVANDVTFSYNGLVTVVDVSPIYPVRYDGTVLEVVVTAQTGTTTGAVGLVLKINGTSYGIGLNQGLTYEVTSINVAVSAEDLIWVECDDIADGLCEDLSITVRFS